MPETHVISVEEFFEMIKNILMITRWHLYIRPMT